MAGKMETAGISLTLANAAGFKGDLKEIGKRLKENGAELTDLGKKYKGHNTTLGSAKKKYELLSDQVKIQQDLVKRLEESYAQAQRTQSLSGEEMDKYKRQIEAANDKLEGFQRRQAAAAEGIKKQFSASLTSAGQKLEKFGTAASKYLTVPIVGAAVAAGKGFIDLEDEIYGVYTIADAAQASIEDLMQDALAASNASGEAATEIAQGMYQAISSGADTSLAGWFTQWAAMAAKAGKTDVTTAVDGATSAINAWALGYENAEAVFDRFIVAQNRGKTTFGELAANIGKVTGIAPQAGMSLDEVLAATAALTKNGVATEAAITGLRAVMSSVIKPTSEAAKMAKQLGIDFSVSAMQSKGFTAFLADIEAKTGGDAEKLGALFGSVQGLSQIMLLGSGAAEDYAETLAEMGASAGTLQKAFDVATGSKAGRMKKSLNQLKNTGTELMESLMPLVDKGINTFTGWVQQFAALDEAGKKNVLTYAGIAAAIGPVTKGVGGLMTGVGKLAKGFSGLGALMGPGGLWAVGAAGAVALASHIYDVASGAAAARKAMEGMKDTAEGWMNTSAETIYRNGANALQRFGLAAADFGPRMAQAGDWYERAMAKFASTKVSNASRESLAGEFAAETDKLREAIRARQQALGGSGLGAEMENDLRLLDQYDAEIDSILRKSQRGGISRGNAARVQELYTLRAEVQLRYAGQSYDSYGQILEGIRREEARANAAGEKADATLYGDALSAAAQGQAEILRGLNAEYDERWNTIQLMQDEQQKTQALADLDADYAARRAEAAEAYRQAVAQIGPQVWEGAGLDKTRDQLVQLYGLLQNYDAGDNGAVQQVNDLVSTLDEGELTSLLTVLTQLADAKVGADALGFDPAALLGVYQQISDVAASYPEQLAGLNTILNGALPQEVRQVLVQLELGDAEKAWKDFEEKTSSLSSTYTVTVNGNVTVGVGLGENWQQQLEAAWKAGKLRVYGKDGLPIEVTPEVVSQLTAEDFVTGRDEDGTLSVQLHGDVELDPLDANRVAMWQAMHPIKVNGSVSIASFALGPEWQKTVEDAWAAGKLQAWGADGLPLTVTPEQISAQDIVLGLDDNGVLHVMVAAHYAGTQEAAEGAVYEAQHQPFMGISFPETKLHDLVLDLERLRKYQNGEYGLFNFMFNNKGQVQNDANDLNVEEITTALGEVYAAMQQGYQPDEKTAEWLGSVAEALRLMQETGIDSNLASAVTQLLQGLGVTAQGDLAGTVEAMYGLGETGGAQYGQGVEAGAAAELDAAYQAGYALGQAMDQGYRDATDTHSPSRVGMEGGEMYGEGVRLGVIRRLGALQGDIADALDFDMDYSQLGGRAAGGDSYETYNTYDNRSYDDRVQVQVAQVQVRDDSDVERIAERLNALARSRRKALGSA